MWFELYKTKCFISDYDNMYDMNNLIQLHRIEYDVNGKPFIIFRYTNNTRSRFFYTELEKKQLIIPLLNEYYNTMDCIVEDRLIDIVFTVQQYEMVEIKININTMILPSYLTHNCINTICMIMMLKMKDLSSREISELLIESSFIPENHNNNKMFKKKDFNIQIKNPD